MKTPKIAMGLFTVAILATGFTITQVQANEDAQDLYSTSQSTVQVTESEEVAPVSVETSDSASAETTEETEIQSTATAANEEVSTLEADVVEAESSPAVSEATSTEVSSSEANVDATQKTVEETTQATATEESEEVAPETETVAAEETTVGDQTENRQIIIERLGLASDALDIYSDEQIAQSRLEAENLGSDPGYSYAWLQEQTPAYANAQSI